MKPFIVGIAGGSGSGKTTLARTLYEHYGEQNCGILAQDSYYIDQSYRFDGDGGSVNFDHPDSLDFNLMAEHLDALVAGQAIEEPEYDFATHRRRLETLHFLPKAIVIVDGILILSQANICERLQLKIFVETPESIRFARRLKRDVEERGRSAEGVIRQFERQVKPMHDLFVEGSKHNADCVVHGTEPIPALMAKVCALIPRPDLP